MVKVEASVNYLLRNSGEQYSLTLDVIAYIDTKLVVVDWNHSTFELMSDIQAPGYHYKNGTVQLKRNDFTKVRVTIQNKNDAMVIKAFCEDEALASLVKEYYEHPTKRTI